MATFTFTVNIQAQNDTEAKAVLTAMFDILKTVRGRTSTEDFIKFSQALVKKPSLVDKAKLFM